MGTLLQILGTNFLSAWGCEHSKALWDEEVTGIAVLHGNEVVSVTEVFNVLFEYDFHEGLL
jgi:hypothetical protein